MGPRLIGGHEALATRHDLNANVLFTEACNMVEYGQPSEWHRALGSPPPARLRAAARRQVLVSWQRAGREMADGGEDAARIRRVATEAAKMTRWVDPTIALPA